MAKSVVTTSCQHDSVVEAEAFLVRMRRTRDAQGLDNLAGVSSAAAPLPVLFGSGSVIGPDSDTDPTLRGEGITVRATAIASARRVATVGAPVPGLSLDGRAPFGVDVAYWDQLSTGVGVTLDVLANENVHLAFFNAIVACGGGTILAVVIGLAFSWIVVRTNTPFKGFIAGASLIPLFVPPLVAGVAWGIVIFGEQHSLWVWAALGLMLVGLALVTPRGETAKDT